MREKGATRLLTVKMPAKDYEQLQELAETQRRTMSEITRLALESYMNAAGVSSNIRVSRGGDRRKGEP